MYDRAGEIEPALHAAAVTLDRFAGPVGEAGEFQDLMHALAEQPIAHALRAAPVQQILDRRDLLEQSDLLRRHAKSAAGGSSFAHDVVTHHADGTRRGRKEAGD